MVPSAIPTTSAPRRFTTFGARSRGPHPRCLRFAPRVAPTGRKTRYRLPQPGLAGRDWIPAGLHYEVSGQVMIILLVQASPGAPECCETEHGGLCQPILDRPQRGPGGTGVDARTDTTQALGERRTLSRRVSSLEILRRQRWATRPGAMTVSVCQPSSIPWNRVG